MRPPSLDRGAAPSLGRLLCLCLPLLLPHTPTLPVEAAPPPANLPPGCSLALEECGPTCGNGYCDGGENAGTCPADCPAVCGDGACTHGENYRACLRDCPAPAGAVIDTLKLSTFNAKLVNGKDWPLQGGDDWFGDEYLSDCTNWLGQGKDCDELRGQNLGNRLMGRTYEQRVFDWADVVMLQETFDDSARNEIREEISSAVYSSYWGQPAGRPELGDDCWNDGGLSGLSKLPWQYDGSMEEVFHDCVTGQAKGFKAVRVFLPNSGRSVYVVNTHLIAGDGKRGTRDDELEQIRDWIDAAIPNQAVVLMGDLNIAGGGEEYLQALCGNPDSRGVCATGRLAGFVDVYRSVWGEPEDGFLKSGFTKNGSEHSQTSSSRKRLDYIFYRESPALGIKPRSRFDVFVDRQPIGNEKIDHDNVKCEYLSDHFALSAALDFCNGACGDPSVPNYLPVVGDGRCNGNESECHFSTTAGECGRNSNLIDSDRDRHCIGAPASSLPEFRNGTFEGSFSPWTRSGSSHWYSDGTAGYDAHTGSGSVAIHTAASPGGGGGGPDAPQRALGFPAPNLEPQPTVPTAVAQLIYVPAKAGSVRLSFWLNVTSSESAGTADDRLFVEIRSASGTLLATPAAFSNLDRTSLGNWIPVGPLDLSSFRGQTVQLQFRATGDTSDATTFRIDDVRVPGAVPEIVSPH